MTKRALTDEQWLILHRHWIWANVMRIEFDKQLAVKGRQDLETFIVDRSGAYMCLWYALLYGVLEEIRKSGVEVPELESAASIMGPLRRFRNAVVHPQDRYWSPKFFEIMQDRESAGKIRAVHTALGAFFLLEARRRETERNQEREGRYRREGKSRT